MENWSVTHETGRGAPTTAGGTAMDTRFSETRGELFKALSKAQSEITGAKKDAVNPFFNSKYADLAACLDAVREPLANNGLCVIQTTRHHEQGEEPSPITVLTTLGHESGEWAEGSITMTPEKAGPQAVGACITYARRYTLAAITGLAQIDDDAESATNHHAPPPPSETAFSSVQKRSRTRNELVKALDDGDDDAVENIRGGMDNDQKHELLGLMTKPQKTLLKEAIERLSPKEEAA